MNVSDSFQKPVILVIEDEPEIRITLSDLLELEGYQVRVARNGREALQLLSDGLKPHLILLDMKMPVMNGWEFAAVYFETHDHEAPIIVMTAAADAEARAKEVHAQDWIGKPFEFDQILVKIRSQMNQ